MGQVKLNIGMGGGGNSGGGEMHFPGTTVIHKFAPEELAYWKGFDGTGPFEGIYDSAAQRLTI